MIVMSARPSRADRFSVMQNDTQVTFYVTRASGTGSATVPLTVVDDCGNWQTVVGGGLNAF